MLTYRLIGVIARFGGRRSFISRLHLWCERARQRRQLQRLDDRLLRDIGLDGAEARREFSKPFWEA